MEKYKPLAINVTQFQIQLSEFPENCFSHLTYLKLTKFPSIFNFDIILNNSPNLEFLDCSLNQHYYCSSTFAPALKKLKNLTYLNLSAREIPEYKEPNKEECPLPFDLFGDGFSNDSLLKVVDFVANHKKLTFLDLSEHNNNGTQLIDEIVNCITTNKKLEILKFSDVFMPSEFTLEIVRSLHQNSTLKMVNLITCCVNPNVRKEIDELHKKNKNITIVSRDLQ